MKIPTVLLIALLVVIDASAQHSTAKSGYFPANYGGDVWTGIVSAVDNAAGEFTLTYTKGDKVETFTGKPEDGYMVSPKNGPQRPLRLSDIHVGRTLSVLYIPLTRKIDGKKVTVNSVFYIQSIPNTRKVPTIFRAFD